MKTIIVIPLLFIIGIISFIIGTNTNGSVAVIENTYSYNTIFIDNNLSKILDILTNINDTNSLNLQTPAITCPPQLISNDDYKNQLTIIENLTKTNLQLTYDNRMLRNECILK